MKFLIVIIISSAFSVSISSQSFKTKNFSKDKVGHPLCSSNIILDSTGYFFKEKGCEGTSYISFGRYKVLPTKKIEFKYLPFDSIQPLREVIRFRSNNKNDSLITVRLFDRQKKLIPFNFNIQVVDKSDQLNDIIADREGKIELNWHKYKEVILRPLLSIYGQAMPIEIDSHSMDIFLNLPILFIIYSDVNIDSNEKLNLFLKKDGLYSYKDKKRQYSLTK